MSRLNTGTTPTSSPLRQEFRVSVVSGDGLAGGIVSAHEPNRVPIGHLERIDYQIVDFTHNERVRVLVWSFHPVIVIRCHLACRTGPLCCPPYYALVRIRVADVLELIET